MSVAMIFVGGFLGAGKTTCWPRRPRDWRPQASESA